MIGLDETDMEILQLLVEDGRRPFSDIAERVGLSGPAVSDRVARLVESNVINRFTVDVAYSELRAGVPVFVRVDAASEDVDELIGRVREADAVQHVFVTADAECWFFARARADDVRGWLGDLFDGIADVDYRVTLVDEVTWEPSLEGATFALTCDECGNSVDDEGESGTFDGDVYHFCCPSCRQRFTDRYDRIAEGV